MLGENSFHAPNGCAVRRILIAPQQSVQRGTAPSAVLPHLWDPWMYSKNRVTFVAGASASGNFSLARDAEDLRGKIGLNLHHQRLVPGAAPPESKTASKNAKKRNRAKVAVLALGSEMAHTTRSACVRALLYCQAHVQTHTSSLTVAFLPRSMLHALKGITWKALATALIARVGSDVADTMQNKTSGEGDGDEEQNGVQEAKPAPAVENVQSGVCLPTVHMQFYCDMQSYANTKASSPSGWKQGAYPKISMCSYLAQSKRCSLKTCAMWVATSAMASVRNCCLHAGVAQMSVSGNDQGEGQEGAADSAKRLRNLQKKLRQVQQLKEKHEKGEPLEPEQVAKIGGEAGLLAEIQSLGG